jgi:hypothetical protein
MGRPGSHDAVGPKTFAHPRQLTFFECPHTHYCMQTTSSPRGFVAHTWAEESSWRSISNWASDLKNYEYE